jgi:hypothetical protein
MRNCAALSQQEYAARGCSKRMQQEDAARGCSKRMQQEDAARVCSNAPCPNAIMNAHIPALLSYPPRIFVHHFPRPPQPSSFPIIPFLTLVLTTPPTPNAGTILHILASALFPQFITTLPTLPSFPPIRASGLLYKSKPSRCNGVLTN